METEKTLIPSIHISTNMRPRLRQGPVIHYSARLSRMRLGSDIHGRAGNITRPRPRKNRQRVLRIGLTPSPTLCYISARLLSSSASFDFLYIDFTINILKSQ